MKKIDGVTAARRFAETYHPDCIAALLFGSVARGEAKIHSDVDILIVVEDGEPFYRRSHRDFGWFIETLVGSRTYCEEKVLHVGRNRNPSLLKSFAEAVILKDQADFAQNVKEKAIARIRQGPEPLDDQEIKQYRYIITDWLDDLADSPVHSEALFIASDLVVKSAELLLAYNVRWGGERKWLYRALQELDSELANQLMEAASEFYRTGSKIRLIEVTELILGLVGGRLYEGYSTVR